MEETNNAPPSPSGLSTPSSIKKKLKSTFNFRKNRHSRQHSYNVPQEWHDSTMSSATTPRDNQDIILTGEPSQLPNDNQIARDDDDDLNPMAVSCPSSRRKMIMSCIRPCPPCAPKGQGHRRRHTFSGDQFKYDALSHALNFEEAGTRGCDDHHNHLNTFTSRLPASSNNKPRRWQNEQTIPVYYGFSYPTSHTTLLTCYPY